MCMCVTAPQTLQTQHNDQIKRQLVRDPQAFVRLRLLDVLEGWLLRFPDRRAHDARLVPYLLALLDDPIQVRRITPTVMCE